MYEWFEAIAGPNYAPALMWTLLALLGLFVILLVVRMIRRMRSGTYIEGGRNRRTRLAILDAAAVDDMRRLVLVRRDDVEHLILIGGPSDVVVEQNIRRHDSASSPVPDGDLARQVQPRRARDMVEPPTPISAPAQSKPSHDKDTASQPPHQVPPVTRPASKSGRVEPPHPAAAPRNSPPASSARQEPVMAPVVATAASETPRAQTHTGSPRVEAAALEQSATNDTVKHSIDLDEALLSELESSLEPHEAPTKPAHATQDRNAEISLDEEMSRLLGDLSDDDRR